MSVEAAPRSESSTVSGHSPRHRPPSIKSPKQELLQHRHHLGSAHNSVGRKDASNWKPTVGPNARLANRIKCGRTEMQLQKLSRIVEQSTNRMESQICVLNASLNSVSTSLVDLRGRTMNNERTLGRIYELINRRLLGDQVTTEQGEMDFGSAEEMLHSPDSCDEPLFGMDGPELEMDPEASSQSSRQHMPRKQFTDLGFRHGSEGFRSRHRNNPRSNLVIQTSNDSGFEKPEYQQQSDSPTDSTATPSLAQAGSGQVDNSVGHDEEGEGGCESAGLRSTDSFPCPNEIQGSNSTNPDYADYNELSSSSDVNPEFSGSDNTILGQLSFGGRFDPGPPPGAVSRDPPSATVSRFNPRPESKSDPLNSGRFYPAVEPNSAPPITPATFGRFDPGLLSEADPVSSFNLNPLSGSNFFDMLISGSCFDAPNSAEIKAEPDDPEDQKCIVASTSNVSLLNLPANHNPTGPNRFTPPGTIKPSAIKRGSMDAKHHFCNARCDRFSVEDVASLPSCPEDVFVLHCISTDRSYSISLKYWRNLIYNKGADKIKFTKKLLALAYDKDELCVSDVTGSPHLKGDYNYAKVPLCWRRLLIIFEILHDRFPEIPVPSCLDDFAKHAELRALRSAINNACRGYFHSHPNKVAIKNLFVHKVTD